MKQLSLTPYHLFRYRGKGYAFDIETNAVLGVDDPAYDALSLQLELATPQVIEQRLTESYGQAIAQNVLDELHWLDEKGLFQGPINTYD